MKKLLFTCITLCVLLSAAQAQHLFGLTSYGGTYNSGAIISYNAATNKLTNVKSFYADGNQPIATLTLADNGKFYGITQSGGSDYAGTLFSYDPVTGNYKQEFNFRWDIGMQPAGSLVSASDGKLYGTATSGGEFGSGIIFSFDPFTSAFTKEYDFDGSIGYGPIDGLIDGGKGKLYGVTYNGGDYSNGAIYSFTIKSKQAVKLYDFDNSNNIGGYPAGGLLLASNGLLYGSSTSGALDGSGAIYSFDIKTNTPVNVYSYGNSDINSVATKFIEGSDSKLYGVSGGGGTNNAGAVFSFNLTTATLTKIADISTVNGWYPIGELYQASNGKIYGTTGYGGIDNAGIIFSFDSTGNESFKKEFEFTYSTGSNPMCGFAEFSKKLFATTATGGQNGSGSMFSLDLSNNDNVDVIRSFGVSDEGNIPMGNLCQSNNALLYGTTQNGGTYNMGTLFSYNPQTNVYHTIFNFNDTLGSVPNGNLIQGAGGIIYGTTLSGGDDHFGVIFSFDPSTNTIKKLYSMGGISGTTQAGVILGIDGNLYGVSSWGGYGGYGNIFKFTLSTNTFTVLHNFDFDTEGGYANGSILQSSNKKLYGVLPYGRNGLGGSIYSYDLSTSTFTIEHRFNWSDGAYGYSGLCEAADGLLYGTCMQGGNSGKGVFFNFNPTTTSFQKFFDGNYNDGAFFMGNFVQSSNGKLYTMSNIGGTDNVGTILSYDLNSASVTKVADLTRNIGANPQYNSTFLEYACNGEITFYKDADGDGYGDINDFVQACLAPDGYVPDNTDCNDSDNTIYPGAPELCDGKDNNCNGIVDENCTLPEIKLHSRTIPEGNSGTTQMAYKISLSKTWYQPVTVDYVTTDKNAKSPSDYIATSGTLTFPPNKKSAYIYITINGDTKVEADEKFNILFSNPVNATLTKTKVSCTILNDDYDVPPPFQQSTSADNMAAKTIVPTVSAYPLPAKDVVNVNLKGFAGNITLRLSTLQGNVISQTTIKQTTQHQLNVSTLANGTYFLTVQDASDNKKTIKIVVIH